MANEVSIYTPRYLAEVVRLAPPVHTYFRDTFFTRTVTFPTERVDIDLVKGDRRMAAFVHPRMGSKVIQNNGYQTVSYKPPRVAPADITTADMLMERMPGETMYSGRTPAQRAAEKMVSDYNKLNTAVTRREEWMAVQAITTGQIPVVGEGVNEVIDFGFTNFVELEDAEQWDQSGADILSNLDDWVNKVLIEGFANVDTVIMGKTALKAFLADETILSLLDNRRVEMGQIVPRDLPNGVRYISHLNKPSVDIYTYAEVYYDDWTDPENPETKTLIPDNMVILIPSHPDFMMAYGANTYIDDASGLWVTSEGPRLFRSFVEHRPDRRLLEVQSNPLPIPDKVDSWLVATVVAE